MTSSNPINPSGSLKPGRIGQPQAMVNRGALKPGRIGLRLHKLPGWELVVSAESESLWRTFRFHRTDTAQAFALFAARAADEHGRRPVISQVWNQVTVTLTGAGGLSEAAMDFAEVLMLLPAGETGPEVPTTPVPETPTPGAETPGPIVQPAPTQPVPEAQPAPEAPAGVEAQPIVRPFAVGRS